MPLTLTFTPLLILADMYMFALSSDWLTTTGSYICRELSITASTSGGADAVRAIKGALVKARKPPSLEKTFSEVTPPEKSAKIYVRTYCTLYYVHTTELSKNPYQSEMQ